MPSSWLDSLRLLTKEGFELFEADSVVLKRCRIGQGFEMLWDMKSTCCLQNAPQFNRVQCNNVAFCCHSKISPRPKKKALAPLAICEAKSHFIVTFVIVIVQYITGLAWTCWIHWILLAHIGTIWHSSQWKAEKTSHTPCVPEVSRWSFKRSASSRSFSTCSPSKVSPRTSAMGSIWHMAAIWIHMDQSRVIQSHPESQNVDMPKESNENCRPSGSSGCLGPDGKVCNWIWRTLFHFHKLEVRGFPRARQTNRCFKVVDSNLWCLFMSVYVIMCASAFGL